MRLFLQGLSVCFLLVACISGTPIPSTPTHSPTSAPTPVPTITATPPPPPEHRIGIRVIDGIGEFYDRVTGEKFIPRGMNYVRLGDQLNPYGETSFYHSVFDPDKYDAERVGTALRQMRRDGYNVVRVFLSQNTIGTAHGGLAEATMRNVADFLTQAKRNQIHVMFTQDWLPAGKYDNLMRGDCCDRFASMNLHFLAPSGLQANIAFFQDFVQYLFNLRAPTDFIFSYELRNELYFDSDLPPLSFTQGVITTANGQSYDMSSAQAKENMLRENLVYWIDSVRAAILEKDPTALVSVGFFQPQEPNPSRLGDPRLAVTAPAIHASQADFIDLHAYPGLDLSLAQYVENFGVNGMEQKPILMGEFGGETSRFISTDLAAQRLINWQVESCRYGFDGWLYWTWDTNEQPNFLHARMDNGRIADALSPQTRPDACSAGTSLNAPTNLTLDASAQASRARTGELATNAIDGVLETAWNSGRAPTQWIEIDLGDPHTIMSFRLTVAQDPAGETTHQLWVRGANGSLRLIHEFTGETADQQVIEFSPDFPIANVQVIRIVTTQSPSLVAWREIEVFGR